MIHWIFFPIGYVRIGFIGKMSLHILNRCLLPVPWQDLPGPLLVPRVSLSWFLPNAPEVHLEFDGVMEKLPMASSAEFKTLEKDICVKSLLSHFMKYLSIQESLEFTRLNYLTAFCSVL